MIKSTAELPPERGSTKQFFVATGPLLGVLMYFIYLAHKRPSILRYNLDQNADDALIKEAYAESEIPLTEMLWVFLVTGVLWCIFTVYIVNFIPKRRKLLSSYLASGVKTVLGDVQFEKIHSNIFMRCFHSCVKADYAFVTYTLHKGDKKDVNFDDSYFDSWMNGNKLNKNSVDTDNVSQNQSETRDVTGIVIQRKIRTYFPFDREQVAILILPDKPRSGVPRADLEKDLATKIAPSKLTKLTIICFFWIVFTTVGSIYILFQMSKIDDDYEDEQQGWIVFALTWVIIMPGISFGWNLLRFFQYARWLTDQGVVRPILDNTEIGGNYVQIQ